MEDKIIGVYAEPSTQLDDNDRIKHFCYCFVFYFFLLCCYCLIEERKKEKKEKQQVNITTCYFTKSANLLFQNKNKKVAMISGRTKTKNKKQTNHNEKKCCFHLFFKVNKQDGNASSRPFFCGNAWNYVVVMGTKCC